MSDNEHLSERADKIRALNDRFRRGDMTLGKVIFVGALAQAPIEKQLLAYGRVKSFEAFEEVNDTYGEHDFGSFDLLGDKFFFKIDYYDHAIQFGAEDPADPKECVRILSIFFADDY
jgi:hypothetical protein